MYKNVKIVLVGGGSVNWSPILINDLMLTEGLSDAEFMIYDIDTNAAERIACLGNIMCSRRNLNSRFTYTDDSKEAFTEADFVIVTISTGGFDAMEHDLIIPEKYDIFQTVGDTVGPGGWARALRNIPVFAKLSQDISKYSNNAVVLNYTNPMSALTDVFYKTGNLRTVGLCHGLFEVYKVLMKIFNLEKESDINVKFGGLNHFFWITGLSINGEDGYALLREKIAARRLSDLINDAFVDNAGFRSDKYVTEEFFSHYGYLPYVGDRHICEFVSYYLTKDEKILEEYKLKRTTIAERREKKIERIEHLNKLISGEENLPDNRSRETAADIISSFVNKKEFIDVVNLPNEGQVENLPRGAIVETLGLVNGLGFSPIGIGRLPEGILNLTLPHARNQMMITEAGLSGDLDKAILALYNDPLCMHLTLPKIKEMGIKLLKANIKYLPQFKEELESLYADS